MPAQRNDAVRRLQAKHAAVVRGIADRRADVAARFHTGQPGRQRRRRATRRSARRHRRVPGIVRRTIDGIVALPVGEQDRHVGLAEEIDAGLLQALDGKRARLCDVVLVLGKAPGRRRTRYLVALLDRHRHAVQRTPDLTAGQRRIGIPRALASALGIHPDHGIELGIVLLDAREKVLQHLDGRRLLRADELGKFDGRLEVQVVHAWLRGEVILRFVLE